MTCSSRGRSNLCLRIATNGRLGKVTAVWAADLVREPEAALAWLARRLCQPRSLWSKAVRPQRNSIVTAGVDAFARCKQPASGQSHRAWDTSR